jgi:signal peptidase I
VRRGSPVPGGVAIFDSPEDGSRLIERVVAVAGERVRVREGRLEVNGRALSPGGEAPEHYESGDVRLHLEFGGGPDLGPVVVPPPSGRRLRLAAALKS